MPRTTLRDEGDNLFLNPHLIIHQPASHAPCCIVGAEQQRHAGLCDAVADDDITVVEGELG